MSFLLTPKNEKMVKILNDQAACGEVKDIFDTLELADDSWAAIFETDEGPLYGALIARGEVVMAGGTGNTTAKELRIDYIAHEGEFVE